jgi:hypothetical protein
MKNFRAKSGPFKERPYFTVQEVEGICVDTLRKVNLYPSSPEPIRIDRLIEKHFNVTPTYEDLADGVLGLTRFGSNGVQSVVVARALDAEESVAAERRIRTTLAHEAGHGLLHAHLFVLGRQEKSLFGDFTDRDAPRVLCRDVSTSSDNQSRPQAKNWWEYQANLAIGGFLLPRPLVQVALEPLLSESGMLGNKTLDSSHFEKAAQLLAKTFDVNPIVARIRLQEMYPQTGQLQL